MNVNRILFPTDFSEHSKVAERTACDYAAHFGAELHVLHVLNDLCLMMPDAAAELLIPPKVLEDLIVSAEEEIEKVPLATAACELFALVRHTRASCNMPRTMPST